MLGQHRSDPDKSCVRVARRDGSVEVRDDKMSFGTHYDVRLVFSDEQFDAYLAGERAGNASDLCIEIARRSDGLYSFRSTIPQPFGAHELLFTEREIDAFRDGVTRGEFDLAAYAIASSGDPQSTPHLVAYA